jgi:hypothetical protein
METTADDGRQHVQGNAENQTKVSVEASLLAVNQDESRANGWANLENSRLGKPIDHAP